MEKKNSVRNPTIEKGVCNEKSTKPQAPWRSVKEFHELRKKGHVSWKCPTHKLARKNKSIISVVEPPSEDSDSDIGDSSSSDSGNEDF